MISCTPMRVLGYRLGLRLGFSPSANFTVRGAPSMRSASGSEPHRFFTNTFSPPMGLAEPCLTICEVSPPASWRYIQMLLCVSTSPIRTSGTIAKPLSLTALTPVWVCGSMSPGVTCLPVASITTAPRGTASPFPTCTTLPARTRRSAFSSRPCGPCVQTVALRTSSTAGCSGIDARPYSIIGRTQGRSIAGTRLATVPRVAPSKASVRVPRNFGSLPLGSEVQPNTSSPLTEPAMSTMPSKPSCSPGKVSSRRPVSEITRAEARLIARRPSRSMFPRMRLSGPSRTSVALKPSGSVEVIAQVPRGSICGGRVTP